MTSPNGMETLADLRHEIDRIDSAMHALLMERGQIIDRLIAVKARQGGGSAFRPGREAEMMRRIAARHRGLLPLDTVEGIWRMIISTFTYVQAPYAVHADASGGDAIIRDCCRFHFGFTVPYRPHPSPDAVIAAVAASAGDLGLVRLVGAPTSGAWWQPLADPGAPKIIARLPFVERRDHPAGTPVFVMAQPLADAAVREIVLYAVALERWHEGLPGCLAALGGDILGTAADGFGLSLLVAVPGLVAADRLQAALAESGASTRLAEVGGHAARFELSAAALEAAQ